MRSLLLLSLCLSVASSAQQTTVLFIGNSYTTENDLPTMFQELALSLGDTVEVALSAPGGFRLDQHFEYAPTLDAIASRPWDVVVLQEQSQIPSVDPSNTALAVSLGSARLLVERIKQNRECTLPVFYMTWGRENGDSEQCPSWPPVCTYEGMQQLLRERYLMMTEMNHGRTAAVGAAWKRVRELRPDIDLYQPDESHPTIAGTYLAACVFYCTVLQASCIGASFTSSLEPSTASALQHIASTTVLDSADTWQLYASPGMSAFVSGVAIDPPSILTLYHPGQGEHLWTCSDGQTSTAAQPVFMLEPGTYEMTHEYTDLCGYTDTWSWTQTVWHISGVGMEESVLTACSVRAVAPGIIELFGVPNATTLTLFDPQGRMVLKEHKVGERSRFNCSQGLFVWRMEHADGTRCTGTVVVP